MLRKQLHARRNKCHTIFVCGQLHTFCLKQEDDCLECVFFVSIKLNWLTGWPCAVWICDCVSYWQPIRGANSQDIHVESSCKVLTNNGRVDSKLQVEIHTCIQCPERSSLTKLIILSLNTISFRFLCRLRPHMCIWKLQNYFFFFHSNIVALFFRGGPPAVAVYCTIRGIVTIPESGCIHWIRRDIFFAKEI